MKLEQVRDLMSVRVADKLGKPKGWMVDKKNINARRAGAEGLVIGCVAGHGGEVFWVSHGGGEIAVYTSDELEPI